jgi:hypothetical protein
MLTLPSATRKIVIAIFAILVLWFFIAEFVSVFNLVVFLKVIGI